MQLIAFSLYCFIFVSAVALFFAVVMWIYSVVMFHRDAWYAARYGRPMFWPFSRWRKS